MADAILFIADDCVDVDVSILRKMFPSTYGFVFFSSAIIFLISMRFETLEPSGRQVVQVSVKRQAHWMNSRSL